MLANTRESWLGLVDSVLRPVRLQRDVERCLRERERHEEARRLFAEGRARAIAHCEKRIEAARAVVFAANDGVISSLMTDLEREWRMLSRRDPDAGMMDLWARIAPSSWIDRKRWRDSDPEQRLDVAVLLASDVRGIEAAESAAHALVGACRPHTKARIRWRLFEADAMKTDCVKHLLAPSLELARAALAKMDAERVILERAQRFEDDVRNAVSGRPEGLAADIGHAAFVDFVWTAAAIPDGANPTTPLRDLWKTGYVLAAVDSAGATLALPR